MNSQNANTEQRFVYVGYQGKENRTEQERILHLLDTYSTTEGFVAQCLPKCIDVSPVKRCRAGFVPQTFRRH